MSWADEDAEASDVRAAREARGFAREQMVACESCARSNPPTRMNCLYCGAGLPVSEANAALRRPALRPLAEWEQGFNVVLIRPAVRHGSAPVSTADTNDAEPLPASGADDPVSPPDEGTLAEAAALLRLEPEPLREMMGARGPLPLARTADEDEAALLESRLTGLGFKVEIVPDELLAVESVPPVRVRKLEFGEEGVRAWAGVGAGPRAAAWGEVALMVRGHLFEKRVEVEEKQARASAEREIASAREMFDDEGLLDLFVESAEGSAHWRVAADSFDYTALGPGKSLLARENFPALVETLRRRAHAAAYDDEYLGVRHLLAPVWPLTERTASGGLRRERPGRFNVEAVTDISNETQFTRYARLRFHLTKRSGAGGQ